MERDVRVVFNCVGVEFGLMIYSQRDEQLEQHQYIHIMDIDHNQVLTSSQTEPERNPT